MSIDRSRRHFLMATGGITATSLVGGVLAGCGGHDDGGPPPAPPPLTTSEQLALTASQAIAAMQSGRLTAEAYVTTLIQRADALSDLHALITLNRDGALAAARA